MKNSIAGISILILLCCSISIEAQNITAAEYFVDTDPGTGKGIILSVTPGTDVNVNFKVNVNLFTIGFHQLYVRVRYANGNWSIAEQRSFYIDNFIGTTLPLLAGAEYFIDTDPGTGKASAISLIPDDSLHIVLNIPVVSLTRGFHHLYVRCRYANGNWGIAEERSFYIDADLQTAKPPLVAAEYFINTDPGVGKGISVPVTKADSVSIDYNFNFNPINLSSGDYIFNVRVQDSVGKWSVAEARPFSFKLLYKSDSLCVGSNYSFASDKPAAGNTYQWQVNTGAGYTNVVASAVYSNENGDTMRLTVPPTSFAGYKYRCITTIGALKDTSTEHILLFKNEWTGAVNTDWNTAGNWSCSSIADGFTDVIVKTGLVNYPVISSNVECRSLNVQKTASIVVNSGFTLKINK